MRGPLSRLVQEQPGRGGQPLRLGLLVVRNTGRRVSRTKAALLGEGLVDLDELPPAMRETVGARVTWNAGGALRARASDIWIGGPSAAARWSRTSARCSPACRARS